MTIRSICTLNLLLNSPLSFQEAMHNIHISYNYSIYHLSNKTKTKYEHYALIFTIVPRFSLSNKNNIDISTGEVYLF